jgi:hypothetical protein
VTHLKDHLLGRLRGHAFEGDEHEFSDEDRGAVSFKYNRLYQHKAMRINYTTYDLRRSQDSINIRTHSDVMVIAHDDEDRSHPYWYARVIGIFHADVFYRNPASGNMDTQQMHFLWVRWFGRDPTYRSGFGAQRLPRIGFVPSDDKFAFGFLSPDVVLRAAHLIPGFAHRQTQELLPCKSVARQRSENDLDWQYYYVNMWVESIYFFFLIFLYVSSFVDRDMFMRHSGEGVGHKSTRHALPYEMDETEWLDEDDIMVVAESDDSEEDSQASDATDMSENESSDDSGNGDDLTLYWGCLDRLLIRLVSNSKNINVHMSVKVR